MPLDVKAISAEIDAILGQYEALRKSAQYDDCSDLDDSKITAMSTTLAAAIERFAPPGSRYLKHQQETLYMYGPTNGSILAPLAGILSSLRDDVTAGRLSPTTKLPPADKAGDLALILCVCERLRDAARQLRDRARGKADFKIEDEYDVQDLLFAVLRAYLKQAIQEDPISKIANCKSSRADISIEAMGVLIEIKFVRSPRDQSTLVQQYAEDLLLYSKWKPLRHLIYLLYNSDGLADPDAMAELSGKQEINGQSFQTHIVLA
jgi:hypothetical protein